ncbi:MAG: type II toxin-antitoxin system VapC family toxin [Pyrinomonadaceae bacterium MAG19_C2-C3]|nr:type II toxin-antitoxin system VapC family toxin [Pyrinomonadaceae bacterium MAG19_C2-C3]
MSAVVADTHSVVWYLLNSPLLSVAAQTAMNNATNGGNAIYVSAISLIEVTYLVEKNRLSNIALQRLENALTQSSSGIIAVSIDIPIAQTLSRVMRADVPDMPDRIIAATALHLSVPLVTRDGKIRASNVVTIW